jgi:hypothetical protein
MQSPYETYMCSTKIKTLKFYQIHNQFISLQKLSVSLLILQTGLLEFFQPSL